jgi:hypothetical protein
VTSSGSTHARRRPTKNSTPCSPRPAPRRPTSTGSALPVLLVCSWTSVTSPASVQGALRVLERNRADRRLFRRQRPPSALANWQPSDQSRPAHHGHRATAQPNRRPRLLRPPQNRRQDLHGSDAGTQTPPLRCRLSTLLADSLRPLGASPGEQPRTTLQSSAADSHPDIDTSDQSLPGPATAKPRTALLAAS